MRERAVAAAGGATFVLISLGAGPLLPQPPSGHPSAADVATYFTRHHSAIVAGSVLAAVAAVALLPMLVALGAQAGGLAGRTVQASGSVLVAVAVIGAVLQVGIASHATGLDHMSLLAGFTVERAVFYSGPALASALLALAAACGRFPSWYRALSAVLGVVAIVAGIGQLGWDNSTSSAGGFGGFLLTIAWAAATVFVVVRADAPMPPTRTAADEERRVRTG